MRVPTVETTRLERRQKRLLLPASGFEGSGRVQPGRRDRPLASCPQADLGNDGQESNLDVVVAAR